MYVGSLEMLSQMEQDLTEIINYTCVYLQCHAKTAAGKQDDSTYFLVYFRDAILVERDLLTIIFYVPSVRNVDKRFQAVYFLLEMVAA